MLRTHGCWRSSSTCQRGLTLHTILDVQRCKALHSNRNGLHKCGVSIAGMHNTPQQLPGG